MKEKSKNKGTGLVTGQEVKPSLSEILGEQGETVLYFYLF